MTDLCHFERLLESVDLIARHADYPGKSQVVARCVEEIEDRLICGQIDEDQEEVLLAILRGGCCTSRSG